jgi:DNA-binding NtrC family response regulator
VKKSILIIDDEFIILESLRIQVSRVISADIMLEVASSGEEAKALIADFKNQGIELIVIISDYNLDDMKGTEILQFAVENFPATKKAILSGQADDDAISAFKNTVGLDARFPKPWDFNEIKAFIQSSI